MLLATVTDAIFTISSLINMFTEQTNNPLPISLFGDHFEPPSLVMDSSVKETFLNRFHQFIILTGDY